MALNASKVESTGGSNGPKQEALEAGSYPARVVQILDLGIQPQRPYKGEEKPPIQEIQLTYELLDEFMLDEEGNEIEDKPRWISERMPLHHLKSERAKSTKRYMVLDPTLTHGGDFSQCLSAPCLVTIVANPGSGKHVGKTFNNVVGITPMRARDAQKAAELVNDPVYFDLDSCDMDVFGKLPDWLKDTITGNLTFEGSKLQGLLGGEEQEQKAPEPEAPDEDEFDDDDQIPF